MQRDAEADRWRSQRSASACGKISGAATVAAYETATEDVGRAWSGPLVTQLKRAAQLSAERLDDARKLVLAAADYELNG